MKPLAFIPVFPGTNCHHETSAAFEAAGARVEIVMHQDLNDGHKRLDECDLIGWSGGFSFGDHLRAGWIAALILVNRFGDQLNKVLEKRIPMIGICNGFQILESTGLLSGTIGRPAALLDQNTSAHFEHWYDTKVVLHETEGGVWTQGLDGMVLHIPSAHGEGRRVILGDDKAQVAATFGSYEGTSDFPVSPNGCAIAGVANKEIMALMPHPERKEEGLEIFRAGVRAVR